jgi:hypothetical protein
MPKRPSRKKKPAQNSTAGVGSKQQSPAERAEQARYADQNAKSIMARFQGRKSI